MRLQIVSIGGYVSGKEIVALTLMRGLKARGVAVDVVSSTWTNGDFPTRLASAAIPTLGLPLGFISASARAWRMTIAQTLRTPDLLLGLASFLRRTKPDRVVHTNWHHALLMIPLLTRSRDLIWLHETLPPAPRYRFVMRLLNARIRGFVVVSKAVADSLGRCGVPHNRVTVIHNGVPIPSLGLVTPPTSTLRIGIVGQIGRWKGHDDAIAALRLLRDRGYEHVSLLIYGDCATPYAEELKASIRRLGLEPNVEWMGFERDIRLIYPRMDICLVPSRSDDPLPTAAIEAQSFGVPVIATRRGGLPEIIVDEETGLLVGAEQPHELADAISRLADDASLRTTMSRRARAHVETCFSDSAFVEKFHEHLFNSGAK